MTYLPSIPSGADIPSMSQSQIQTNFQQLENVFGADHYAWDYATTLLRGLHQQVTLPQLLESLESQSGVAFTLLKLFAF